MLRNEKKDREYSYLNYACEAKVSSTKVERGKNDKRKN